MQLKSSFHLFPYHHHIVIAPSGSPLDVTVTAVNSTALQLSWNPPLASQQNGVIRSYDIQIVEIETLLQSLFTSNSTSFIVPQLHPYYSYDVAVSAVTVGAGPFSGSERVTTLEDGTDTCVTLSMPGIHIYIL